MSPPPPALPPDAPDPVVTSPETAAVPLRGWRRLPVWAWLLILLIVGSTLAAIAAGTLIVGRFLGEGWDLFERDAQAALQRNPTIQEHIGSIRDIDLNLLATGSTIHPEDFVFDVDGERADGTVRARFETTLEGELIREGVLRIHGGGEFPLAPDPGMPADDRSGD